MFAIRRKCFTFIEIMLVMVIILSITGMIGINVIYAVREQRFRSEVNQIVHTLRLAQDLMLIFNANITARISVKPNFNGYQIELVPEVPLAISWLKELSKPKELISINIINFSGLQSASQHLDLKFRSGGSDMPKGYLRLSTALVDGPNVLTRYINLPGHPAPIVDSAESHEPSTINPELESLTKHVIEVIRAKVG